jgi:asparagine synthase (glutamine-hydrolysing)
MCGIAGIIAPLSPDEAALQACGSVMAHRGPDAQGVVRRDGATLVFRRLAIIDLSPCGNQPMSNETDDTWVVFNGEIYNYAKLRDELKGDHRFKSKSDTEVLVHGYEQWGLDGLLKRIDGMFAFAIWDERRQQLFFARDRVGKKPFYYSPTRDGFAFASTLNALVELRPERPQIDPVARR